MTASLQTAVEVGNDSQQQDVFQALDEEGEQRTNIEYNKERNTEFYGNNIKNISKTDNILRIGFLNINGLPTFKSHHKHNLLHAAVQDHNMDIIGMTEVNENWAMVEHANRWQDRTRG